MKKMLEHLINYVHKEDLEILFGKDCKVTVNEVKYITNQKKFLIDSTLHANFDFDSLEEEKKVDEIIQVYPFGLHLIISESWKYMGIEKELIFSNSLEFQ